MPDHEFEPGQEVEPEHDQEQEHELELVELEHQDHDLELEQDEEQEMEQYQELEQEDLEPEQDEIIEEDGESNSAWPEVIRFVWLPFRSRGTVLSVIFLPISSEEVASSPVAEYWSAPHPQLAHLPQLPHPLSGSTAAGKLIFFINSLQI